MRLIAFERDDQALDLRRQLVGVAQRPARAVAQRLEPVLLVAIEDLVAGLARDAELAADLASSPRRPAAGPQTADARPSPNTPSTASTPPARHAWRKVLPMCPVQNCHLCLGPLKGHTQTAPRRVLFFGEAGGKLSVRNRADRRRWEISLVLAILTIIRLRRVGIVRGNSRVQLDEEATHFAAFSLRPPGEALGQAQLSQFRLSPPETLYDFSEGDRVPTRRRSIR